MERRDFIKGIGVGVLATLPMFFLGCEKRIDLNPKEVKWDRAECERCAMMMGDPDFVAQAVSLEDGKSYFFDDIGCAILWLSSNGNDVKLENVILYVNNGQNEEFIKADEAIYTTTEPSPMGFNFLAHPKGTKLENTITYSEVVRRSKASNN